MKTMNHAVCLAVVVALCGCEPPDDEPPREKDPAVPQAEATTGDRWALEIADDARGRVEHVEALRASAPRGFDPLVTTEHGFGAIDAGALPLILEAGAAVGAGYAEVFHITVHAGVGRTEMSLALRVDYTGPAGVFGGDDGEHTSGTVEVTRSDERVEGRYDLHLCAKSELAAGHCDSGTTRFSGDFDIGAPGPPDVFLPDLDCRVTGAEYVYPDDELEVRVMVRNRGKGAMPVDVRDFGLGFNFARRPRGLFVTPDHVERVFVPRLSPGRVSVQTVRLNLNDLDRVLPAAVDRVGPGFAFCRADVTDAVEESNEWNNWGLPDFWDDRRPDLTIEIEAAGADGAVHWSEVVIRNEGTRRVESRGDVELEIQVCPESRAADVPCDTPGFGRATVSVPIPSGSGMLRPGGEIRRKLAQAFEWPSRGTARAFVRIHDPLGANIEASDDNNVSAPFDWGHSPIHEVPGRRVELGGAPLAEGVHVRGGGDVYVISELEPGRSYKVALEGMEVQGSFQAREPDEDGGIGPLIRACSAQEYTLGTAISSSRHHSVACEVVATHTEMLIVTRAPGTGASQGLLTVVPHAETDLGIEITSVVPRGADLVTVHYRIENHGPHPTGRRRFFVELWSQRVPVAEQILTNEADLLDGGIALQLVGPVRPDDGGTRTTGELAVGASFEGSVEVRTHGAVGGWAHAQVSTDSEFADPEERNDLSPGFRWGSMANAAVQGVEVRRYSWVNPDGEVDAFAVVDFTIRNTGAARLERCGALELVIEDNTGSQLRSLETSLCVSLAPGEHVTVTDYEVGAVDPTANPFVFLAWGLLHPTAEVDYLDNVEGDYDVGDLIPF